MAFRPVQPLPRPLRALAAALALAVVAALPAAARADCPGGGATCPYTAASQVGQRAEGVMRFPQALAIGPDGSVFVADQGSHVVQVFGPDGVFRREFGIAGSKPGQLSGVGAIAVAGDGSVLVADGANRIDRFDANGQLMNSWGGTGSDVGEFRFGAGAGNSAAAGGGLAVSGDFVYVADTGNDRIQRFTLDGGHGAEIVPPGTAGQPARDRRATHPAVRGRRPAPSARRLRHRRAPPARGRPGRLGPGPAQLPLRRGHRRRRARVRGRRPQPPRRALQQRAAVPVQGALGLLRDGRRGGSPIRAASRSIPRATSTWPTPATTASTSSTRAARSCARSARRAGRWASSTRRWASRRTPAACAR